VWFFCLCFFFHNVLKQCLKPSPSLHHFYRWYKLTILPHGWFMTLFYPH
jgi:hypothetical protein